MEEGNPRMTETGSSMEGPGEQIDRPPRVDFQPKTGDYHLYPRLNGSFLPQILFHIKKGVWLNLYSPHRGVSLVGILGPRLHLPLNRSQKLKL